MEVVKPNKKFKKRRHHSFDTYKKSVVEVTKILYKEKRKIIENSESPEHSTNAISKRITKSVQTDVFDISETLEKDEQIKSLTEKLQQAVNKLCESKNAYSSLKQDFNKAQKERLSKNVVFELTYNNKQTNSKLLCSEVGEHVTVAGLSNQFKGWRGRAEQIQQLQQKISELQSKVSNGDGSRRKSLESRSSSSIQNLDKEKKRQQIENLSKELKDTETALECSKKKLEAAKARIAVLENDCNASKKTIGLLNEKTIHDNQLIEALHDQLKIVEAKFEERESVLKKQNEKSEREMVLLKSELEASELHMKNFERKLNEKDKEIEAIKSRNAIDVDQRTREFREADEDEALRETSMHGSGNCAIDANEYIAIGIAAEAERERLLELVTVLNQRLDKACNDSEQLSESFRKERNRAAKLELRLQKMELERVVSSKVNTGSYRLKAPKPIVTPKSALNEAEETQLKLELIQEECLALKTRLATVQKDKASDLTTFKKLLQQTRKIFRDAYRGKLPASESNSNVTL